MAAGPELLPSVGAVSADCRREHAASICRSRSDRWPQGPRCFHLSEQVGRRPFRESRAASRYVRSRSTYGRREARAASTCRSRSADGRRARAASICRSRSADCRRARAAYICRSRSAVWPQGGPRCFQSGGEYRPTASGGPRCFHVSEQVGRRPQGPRCFHRAEQVGRWQCRSFRCHRLVQ